MQWVLVSCLVSRVVDSKYVVRQVSRCFFVFAAIVLSLGSAARADDACIALLKHGIYASHVTQSSTQTYHNFQSSFCSWYSSYRQTNNGASVNATIPIADIPLGLGASMTYGEADSLNNVICQSTFNLQNNDVRFSDASTYIDSAGAAAFHDCVVAYSKGVKTEAKIDDDEVNVVVDMHYDAPTGAGPGKVMRVDAPPNDWDCSKPPGSIDIRDFVGKPNGFTNQNLTLVCTRKLAAAPFMYDGRLITAKSTKLNISTSAGGYTVFFRPKYFNEPIADSAKVLAALPRGTILLWAGAVERVPVGWQICNGAQGSINLNNAFPRGVSQNNLIGNTGGNSTYTFHINFASGIPKGANNDINQHDHHDAIAMGTDHVHQITGDTDAKDIIPPYANVMFIQKMQ